MIQNLVCPIPELSHIELKDNIPFFTTVGGVTGFAIKCKLIDLEAKDALESYEIFQEILKQIPHQVLVKTTLQDLYVTPEYKTTFSRSDTVKKIGVRNKTLILSFEWKVKDQITLLNLPMQQVLRLGSSLSEEDLRAIFSPPHSEILESNTSVDFGDQLKGIYRIYRQGVDPMSISTLSEKLEGLTGSYEVVASIKKCDPARIESRLKRASTRGKVGNTAVAQEKVTAAEEALRAVSLYGEHFYSIDWVIIVTDVNEGSLREKLSLIRASLSSFGVGTIESAGAYRSYITSLIGSGRQHVPFIEQSPTALFYLPIATYGEELPFQDGAKTTLLLHREDGSLHGFDQFDPRFSSYNMIVTGKTGSGKSVFGNVNSRALLNDPEVHMIKVDVGGSYKRECAEYNGLEVCFNLNTPSGIDPFSFINQEIGVNDSVGVLTEFVCTLALEEGETFISREMKGDYESSIKNYIKNTTNPSYTDFLSLNSELPRIKLLKRWDRGGQYENALSTERKLDFTNRYLYFNFENILTAANPDYVAGVMAAVIAKVNIDLLWLSLPKNRKLGKRLVFFCDETKFFLEKNGQFFLLTSANFRKFGHANILTGQNIRDFVLNINGRDDLGLILNSPIRVFYEAAIDPEFLKTTFSLNDREIHFIRNNPYKGKEFRQFILQDDLGTRLSRLYLTRPEYLSMTSSRSEVDKINKITEAFPELNRDEVIGLIQLGGLV